MEARPRERVEPREPRVGWDWHTVVALHSQIEGAWSKIDPWISWRLRAEPTWCDGIATKRHDAVAVLDGARNSASAKWRKHCTGTLYLQQAPATDPTVLRRNGRRTRSPLQRAVHTRRVAALHLRRVGRRDGSTRQVRRRASAPHVFRGTRAPRAQEPHTVTHALTHTHCYNLQYLSAYTTSGTQSVDSTRVPDV